MVSPCSSFKFACPGYKTQCLINNTYFAFIVNERKPNKHTAGLFFNLYNMGLNLFFALKFGISTIPPFLLSSMRFLLAGGLLLIYCLLKRKTFPNIKAILYNSICGVLMLGRSCFCRNNKLY